MSNSALQLVDAFHRPLVVSRAKVYGRKKLFASRVLKFDYDQGLTLTLQRISQVASDILDVTTISVCLIAKLASGNRKSLAKT